MKALLGLVLVGCAASHPTPAQEARFGTYVDALAACNAKLALDTQEAKARGDASRAELLASYEACAHAVDIAWGRAK